MTAMRRAGEFFISALELFSHGGTILARPVVAVSGGFGVDLGSFGSRRITRPMERGVWRVGLRGGEQAMFSQTLYGRARQEGERDCRQRWRSWGR